MALIKRIFCLQTVSGVVVEGGRDTVEEHAVEWFAINSAELLGRFMVSYIV